MFFLLNEIRRIHSQVNFSYKISFFCQSENRIRLDTNFIKFSGIFAYIRKYIRFIFELNLRHGWQKYLIEGETILDQ